MSEQKNPVEQKEKGKNNSVKGDVIVWVLTLLILALFTLLMFVLGRLESKNREYFATLTAFDGRYGDQGVAILTFENDYAVMERDIGWFVDGEQVKSLAYGEEGALELALGDLAVGSHLIEVKVDEKVIASGSFIQQKPLLQVILPTVERRYGEQIGDLKAEAKGWVDLDDEEKSGFDGTVRFDVNGRLDVGTYPLYFDGFKSDKYDVEVIEGWVKVLPMQLAFEPCFFSKVYDGSKNAHCNGLKLAGVLADDIVGVVATAEFCDKKAGVDKKVKILDLTLVGKDADNYTVDFESAEFSGSITPLCVRLEGAKAVDKIYDGTDSVTFADGGRLVGVLQGDSVSVGMISARFEDVKKGSDKKVLIESVKLVGVDGENYCVEPTETTASIFGKKTSAVPGHNG